MFNSLGNILKLTTYGESHGEAIGGILDGMPAGVRLDLNSIHHQLQRRKPGQSEITTSRSENEEFRLLSGIKDGMTTGHSIGFQIPNTNQKSDDYSDLNQAFRPSHADYTYFNKYGLRIESGGGRASARETANWVLAGAIAKHLIHNVEIFSFVSSVNDIQCPYDEVNTDLSIIESNIVRCPDPIIAERIISKIKEAKENGDSLGGTITCVVKNLPLGLGEPIFHKLESEIGRAMLSINACKGIEFGSGFDGTKMKGSEHNDILLESGKTKTNHSGGIQGGISNGMELIFKLAFKPTSTILTPQKTIDTSNNTVEISGKGRHDPCVLPRAVPIVDMLTSFVLADLNLLSKIRRF